MHCHRTWSGSDQRAYFDIVKGARIHVQSIETALDNIMHTLTIMPVLGLCQVHLTKAMVSYPKSRP